MRERMRRSEFWLLVCVTMVALVGLTSGCGFGVGPVRADGRSGSTSDSSPPPAEQVIEPITRELGKTGWHDGFGITVDKATVDKATVDTARFGLGVAVVLDVTYENLGDKAAGPPVRGSFLVSDEVIPATFDSPQMPGKGKADGTVGLSLSDRDALKAISADANSRDPVDSEKLLDSITLVFGESGDNQTRIPLAASGRVESVQPRVLTATGQLVQDQIVIDVVGAGISPSYRSGEKGKSPVSLKIKISCGPRCRSAGYNTSSDQFSVKAPDGSSVVADTRSKYCCDAIYPGTVSDSIRNVLTFVVPSPGTGSYILTYNNTNLTDRGSPAPTLAFTA